MTDVMNQIFDRALGIPYDQIFEKAAGGEIQDSVLAGSKREINYLLLPDQFRIWDPQRPDLYMSASIRLTKGERFANFQFVTRPGVVQDGLASERHPDMVPKQFVGVVLEKFPYTSAIEVVWNWCYPEFNFGPFVGAYLKSADKIQAARSTRSAQVYAPFGFAVRNTEDVCIDPDSTNIQVVRAIFRKI